MLRSLQLSENAGKFMWADMEIRQLEVQRWYRGPAWYDRAATIAVKHWTSCLPGFTVRHTPGAASVATCWFWKLEVVATKAGSPHSHFSASLWVPRLGHTSLSQLPQWEVGPAIPKNRYQRSMAEAPFSSEWYCTCYVCVSVCVVGELWMCTLVVWQKHPTTASEEPLLKATWCIFTTG